MGASAKVVDLSGVKDRGNFNTKRVPSGDYAAKIVKVEDGESSKDQSFQYIFTIKLIKYSQFSYPYYCKLQENQLWKLRNVLVAAGLNVPKKRIKLDPNKAVGKTVGVTMTDDEYEGREKSTIDAIFPVSELADGESVDHSDEDFEDDAPVAAVNDDDVEEEVPAEKPKKKKKKGKKAKDENLEELDISDV